jgi:TusE/DsrC/DsvC family sulfur relay protein
MQALWIWLLKTEPFNPGFKVENFWFYFLSYFFRRKVMPSMDVNGSAVDVDEEGYLSDINDWNKDIAVALAETEEVELTESHWEVIDFLREYYDEYQIAPAVRVLTKAIGKKLGKDKGNSKYLYELFPYGPAKQACKIGGLPKPTGCI